MKPLMGVVLAGHSKDYAIPKFLEMAEAYVDHDILFAVDEFRSDIPYNQVIVSEMKGKFWATEIVYYGKEALKEEAISDNYTHLIWQGIDCYYYNKGDYQRLLHYGEKWPIVGALVAGRNRASYPVCREFVYSKWDPKIGHVLSTEQREIKPWILDIDVPVTIRGYIGSDATCIDVGIFDHVTMEGYQHWHERPNRDIPLGELGPEEWFMYKAVQNYIDPVVDAANRPYHAHEDGTVVRYKGEVYKLQDINFV